MGILILFLSTLFLSACGTETKTEYVDVVKEVVVEVEKPQLDPLRINLEWSGEFSAWWEHPHTNASISLDDDGYVWVHVASRGLAHKFQSGKILKSQTPYELDFECVDGCLNIE